jgi:hypothetical protein
MHVYEINTLPKPPKSRFPHYANLVAESGVWRFIGDRGEFRGVPLNNWKPQTFYIEKPLYPKPNFFHIGVGVFVCDERARELAAEPMEMSGEFLPIKIEGEQGKFWIYNCTNCINVVNAEASKYWKFGPGLDDQQMDRPAFFASRFGEETVFKIPEDRGAIMYCAEFTGDPDDGEFKAVVEHHGLTGLAFELIWTDSKP